MNQIILLGIVQVLFITVFIITKKKKKKSDYVLMIWLLFTSIPLIIQYLNYEEYSYILKNTKNFPSWLMKIYLPFFLGHSPFIYIYIRSLTNKNPFKKKYLLFFIPFLLCIIIINTFYDFSLYDKVNFSIEELKYPIILLSFFILAFIIILYSLTITYLEINKYKKHLKNNYSKSYFSDVLWLNTIFYTNLIFWTILVFLIVLIKIHIIDNEYNVPFFMATIFVFVISFIGFKIPNLFVIPDQTNKITKPKDYKNTDNINKLINYMNENKPYLSHELSLKQLAEQLNLQSYQLSRLINQHLKKTFFDFINEYRVEEAKKNIIQNKNLTLIAIAYECGFNSKSSFNRIFKKITGKTPSQFKNNRLNL